MPTFFQLTARYDNSPKNVGNIADFHGIIYFIIYDNFTVLLGLNSSHRKVSSVRMCVLETVKQFARSL